MKDRKIFIRAGITIGMDLGKTLLESMAAPSAYEISSAAAARIRQHFRDTGKNLEALAREGMVRIPDFDHRDIAQLLLKRAYGVATGREIRAITDAYRNVVEGIGAMTEGNVYVVPASVIKPPRIPNGGRLRKLGDRVKLKRHESAQQARDANATPASLMRDAFSQVKPYKFYVGYDFPGIREGEGSTFNSVLLEDCVDAAMIFAYSTANGKSDRSAEIMLTQDDDSVGALAKGGMFAYFVPSVEKETVQRYRVVMKSVPLRIKGFQVTDHSVWFNINAEHDCVARQESANTKSTRRGTRDFCKHLSAGMLYIAWLLRNSGGPYEVAYLPNVVPTESFFENAMKLRKQVIVVDESHGKLVYSAPTKIQRELLDWKWVSFHGFDEGFAARKGFERYVLGS